MSTQALTDALARADSATESHYDALVALAEVVRAYLAPPMLGSDLTSPAGLVAKYGEVQVHWATGLAYIGNTVWGIADSGWVSYLEMARIREITQGEG